MTCGLKPQATEPTQPVSESASPYEPWQQRVIDEKTELCDKISKLAAFLAGEPFLALNEQEQIRLTRQLNVMKDYRTILTERIEAWNPPPTVEASGTVSE